MQVIETEKPNQTLSLIKPVAQPKELITYHQDMRVIIRDSLIEGTDYGKVPGTDKPTLFKPGAEKICIAFGCSPKYEKISAEIDHDKEVKWQKKRKKWNNAYQGDRTFSWEIEEGTSLGLYRYLYKCRIVRSDGRELGEGEGVCSTLESKFIDRPRDCENNVCKMAQKRSFVAATLNSFGLSDCFTQDLEDDHHAPKTGARPPQEEKPPTVVQKESPVYDAKDEKMKAALFKIFNDKELDTNYHEELSEMLHGKQFNMGEVNKLLKDNNL